MNTESIVCGFLTTLDAARWWVQYLISMSYYFVIENVKTVGVELVRYIPIIIKEQHSMKFENVVIFVAFWNTDAVIRVIR